ncbi:hypothetical protein DMC47_34410 [Nostoc sp. 3335mG]|nr:hypothetical protein DMC47_34410 [Nostoc sp. 3335mG]
MIVLVPKSVVLAIGLERARHLPLETGGFLIGTRRGPHIDVTGYTDQGPDDVATRTSFERLCASHRARIHAAWKASGHVESLVGDWHSHPIGSANPSSIDCSAWRTLVRTSGKTMVGVVDAGAEIPSVYLAAEAQRPFARQMSLEEEATGMLAFRGEVPLPCVRTPLPDRDRPRFTFLVRSR